jgi:hypothetical protein
MDENETKTHNLLRNHTHTSESTITCQKHEGKLEPKRGGLVSLLMSYMVHGLNLIEIMKK